MTLRSIAEAETALEKYIGTSPKRGSYKLDNMKRFMAEIGNPQNNYQVIHIAGTSGKTSTSYYAEALCRELGLRTGLTVSPHIDSIQERAQINGESMEQAAFLEYLSLFLAIVDKTGIPLSYFEVMVAFAYWVFERENVDVAVVEVGLGGLLDGTNVIENENKVCIVTDIGLDHVEILGTTLDAIAFQKAGIIGYRNSVFINRQPDIVVDVIKAVSKEKEADLYINETPVEAATTLGLPPFQVRNLSLASRAVGYLAGSMGKELTSSAIKAVGVATHIPARMEKLTFENRTLILDGAHNGQKMKALVDALKQEYPDKKIHAIVAVGTNKRSSVEEMFKELAQVVSTLYLTSFGHNQDEFRASMDTETMRQAAHAAGLTEGATDEVPMRLLREVVKKSDPEELILITGSYYLFNSIRPYLSDRD